MQQSMSEQAYNYDSLLPILLLQTLREEEDLAQHRVPMKH